MTQPPRIRVRARVQEVMARDVEEEEGALADGAVEGGDTDHAFEDEARGAVDPIEEARAIAAATALGRAKDKDAQRANAMLRRQLEVATTMKKITDSDVAKHATRVATERFGTAELKAASNCETNGHPVLMQVTSANSALCSRTVNLMKSTAEVVTSTLDQLQALLPFLQPSDKGLAALAIVEKCASGMRGYEKSIFEEARLVLDQVVETGYLTATCLAANSFTALGQFAPTLGVQEPQSAGVVRAQRLFEAAKASANSKESKLNLELFKNEKNRSKERSPSERTNRCYICDDPGHYATTCPTRRTWKNRSRSRSPKHTARSRSPNPRRDRRRSPSPKRKATSPERPKSGSSKTSTRS